MRLEHALLLQIAPNNGQARCLIKSVTFDLVPCLLHAGQTFMNKADIMSRLCGLARPGADCHQSCHGRIGNQSAA
jgi:hypothetical protein